ncbi:zinc-dependent alcohol dehydrogenase family protein [Paraglaciecola marina]|uniref:zinc-dependent alcohol dehydrogenase family protein n=1 Tax=Paraglaciecola marina TaxID=2500157 RepID=UPI0014151706|nr:zinc-dependent alcohol dehydrogenase family protein [Paraglaciecola marina]
MPREWVIDKYVGYEGLRLTECNIEQPGATEVRLKIEAFALNWGDNDLMNDRYSFSFSSLPARVGMEAAGIVEAVGSNVKGVTTGERYCTLPHFYDRSGASGETLIIDQAYITPAPSGLSAVEASSVWMQFMTAYFPIVELCKAGPEKNIFIPAGTSTAGWAAIQIAKLQDATVITTTRSQANVQYLYDAGADHVFVDEGGDIEQYLKEITHSVGIHGSFDPVGGNFMERYANAMAKGGMLILYGGLSGTYSHPPFLPMIQNSLWFHAYSLFNYVENTESCERGKAYVYEALKSGKLKPKVDKVFQMEEYIEAWKYLSSNRCSYGKVVVKTGL